MQGLYIPQSDVAFSHFFRGINQYVAVKTIGAAPAWTHIPDTERAYLNQVYIDWYSAYVLTFDSHASQASREAKRLRAISERALSSFVNSFLRIEPVTDADRDNMGIPNFDQTRKPGIETTEVVEFEFKLLNLRKLLADFLKKGVAVKQNRTATWQ